MIETWNNGLTKTEKENKNKNILTCQTVVYMPFWHVSMTLDHLTWSALAFNNLFEHTGLFDLTKQKHYLCV